jgi:hypothetical protein
LDRFEILYEDHRALLRLGRALAETTRSYVRSDQATLLQNRCDLAKRVTAHLIREAAMVLAPLRQSPEPAHRALARQYCEGLLAMRSESTAHHAIWSFPAALEDMAGDHVSVRKLVDGLADRIAWEEDELFPAAAALPVARAESVAA